MFLVMGLLSVRLPQGNKRNLSWHATINRFEPQINETGHGTEMYFTQTFKLFDLT
jgi:hypothetical protein